MGRGKRNFPKNKQESKRIKIKDFVTKQNDIIQIVGTFRPTVFRMRKDLKLKRSLWREKKAQEGL